MFIVSYLLINFNLLKVTEIFKKNKLKKVHNTAVNFYDRINYAKNPRNHFHNKKGIF